MWRRRLLIESDGEVSVITISEIGVDGGSICIEQACNIGDGFIVWLALDGRDVRMRETLD